LGGLGTASLALAVPAGATTNSNVACGNVYGPNGLVAAINAANASGGGSIGLALNCTYLLTHPDNDFQGPNGLPVITSPITITGAKTTIERASTAPPFRIFLVDTTGNLNLANSLVITGGQSVNGGGAITNHGFVTVTNSRITGNTAPSGGAGIANGPGPDNGPAVLTLHNSRVDNNTTTVPNGFGGGIGNSGTVTLLSSEVDHNNLVTTVANPNVGGGGIGNFNTGGGAGNGPGILKLNSSKVHDNTTGGFGGGILNENFAGATVTSVTLNSTTVNNNSATDGGGIFNNFEGAVSLASSPVFGNNPNNCAPPGSVPGCSG
jgi:hypothetical protein